MKELKSFNALERRYFNVKKKSLTKYGDDWTQQRIKEVKQALTAPTKEKIGYKKLKDGEWRGEKLNGRVIFYSTKQDCIIVINKNEVYKVGGIEYLSFTRDEILFISYFMKASDV